MTVPPYLQEWKEIEQPTYKSGWVKYLEKPEYNWAKVFLYIHDNNLSDSLTPNLELFPVDKRSNFFF